MGTPRTLVGMGREVEAVNRTKGWYDVDRTFGEDIALLHSEASEMLEAYRRYDLQDATVYRVIGDDGSLIPAVNPKPEGVGAEAADVLIRLLDTCTRHGIDLEGEYERKMVYNRTRPYRHGGRAL